MSRTDQRPAPPRPGPPGPAADAPHAPRRGWIARLLGPFHVTGVFWYWLHSLGARLPQPLIRFLMPFFVAFFFLSLWSIRRAVASNLEVVLGPCGWLERQRRIWRTFREVAWSHTERYQRLVGSQDFDVDAEGMERWQRATAPGRGAVLVTGHIGNWEMASTLPATREGKRVHVVREEEMDPRAQAFVESRLKRRAGEGYVTHFAAAQDPRLGLELREALERGEVVSLQADRPRRGGRVVETTLFDRPYAVPSGPLALARQAAVPLLPVFVFRLGERRYRVRFGSLITVERGSDRRAEMAAAARELAEELEGAIRFRPHQWFVFRELW